MAEKMTWRASYLESGVEYFEGDISVNFVWIKKNRVLRLSDFVDHSQSPLLPAPTPESEPEPEPAFHAMEFDFFIF